MFLRVFIQNVRRPVCAIHRTHQYRKLIVSDNVLRTVNYTTDKTVSPISAGTELSEEDYRNLCVDPDSFGTLSISVERPEVKDAAAKIKTKAALMEEHTANINDLIEKKDIISAVNTFEKDILQKHQLHPPISMFERLLNECIRFEMPERAFQMYNHMIERRLPVSLEIIEKLVLSCEMLEQTTRKMNSIKRTMALSNMKPNAVIYNALIRNYIRSGQWKEGFSWAKQLESDGFELELETYPFILRGCSYDERNGFRKAIEFWHEAHRRSPVVNVDTFNAILKCISKCSIGDVDVLRKTIKTIQNNYKENVNATSVQTDDDIQNETVKPPINDGRPNILNHPPIIGSLFLLENAINPDHRLLISGGLTGMVKLMQSNAIVPTLETIDLLLDVIPNTAVAENKLLSLMNKHNITQTIELFQKLLTRMCLRHDFDGAKRIVQCMYDQEIEIDLITYGLVAISCRTAKDADEFLKEMKQSNSKPNIDILNGMLTNACRFKDNNYVIKLLRFMQSEEIEPTEQSIEILNDYTKYAFSKLRKYKMADKHDRNEFFKLSREHRQWVKRFNLNKPQLISTLDQDSENSLKNNSNSLKNSSNSSKKNYKKKYEKKYND